MAAASRHTTHSDAGEAAEEEEFSALRDFFRGIRCRLFDADARLLCRLPSSCSFRFRDEDDDGDDNEEEEDEKSSSDGSIKVSEVWLADGDDDNERLGIALPLSRAPFDLDFGGDPGGEVNDSLLLFLFFGFAVLPLFDFDLAEEEEEDNDDEDDEESGTFQSGCEAKSQRALWSNLQPPSSCRLACKAFVSFS